MTEKHEAATPDKELPPLPPVVQEAIDAHAKYYAEHHKLGMSIRDDMSYIARVAMRWKPEPAVVSRTYQCGCITCICPENDENRCYGCGAKSCGKGDAECAWKQEAIRAARSETAQRDAVLEEAAQAELSRLAVGHPAWPILSRCAEALSATGERQK